MKIMCFALAVILSAPAFAESFPRRVGEYTVVASNAKDVADYKKRLPLAKSHLREVEDELKRSEAVLKKYQEEDGLADIPGQSRRFAALGDKGEAMFPRGTTLFRCGRLGGAAYELWMVRWRSTNGQVDRRNYEWAHKFWLDAQHECIRDMKEGVEPTLTVVAPAGSRQLPFKECAEILDLTISTAEAEKKPRTWTCPAASVPKS